MRLAIALVCLVCCEAATSAQRYIAVTPGDEIKALAIKTDSGNLQAPFTETDQASFGSVRISPTGDSVGWLALVTNCCTSYPLPLALVIFRDGKVAYQFREDSAIWRWTYLAHGTQVAYQWSLPHGFIPTYYTLRSLRTGVVLDRFVCGINESTHEYIKPAHIPDWVRAVEPKYTCPGI